MAHGESLRVGAEGEGFLASSGTRGGLPGVTELSEVWPEVDRRLHGFLRKRGTTRADAEDVIQGVAERALASRIRFEDADDLLRWCLVVARNLDVDQRRRTARHEGILERSSIEATSPCPEETVLTRLRLQSALRHLHGLSSRDRALIVSSLTDNGESSSGRDRVARHRARAKLLKLVGPPCLVLACAQRTLRNLARANAAPAAWGAAMGLAAVAAVCISGTEATRPALLRADHGIGVSPAPSTHAREQSGPPTDARLPTKNQAAAALLAGGAQVLVSPPRPHVVGVEGHARRQSDTGMVCVDDAPVIGHLCVGPTSLPPGHVDQGVPVRPDAAGDHAAQEGML